MSGEKTNFQYILRLLNTNVDGKQKIMYALTRIKGVGRRYANLVCKKADVDLTKRYVLFPVSSGHQSVETTILIQNPSNSAPERSPSKSSSASSPSSRTRLTTRSRAGS